MVVSNDFKWWSGCFYVVSNSNKMCMYSFLFSMFSWWLAFQTTPLNSITKHSSPSTCIMLPQINGRKNSGPSKPTITQNYTNTSNSASRNVNKQASRTKTTDNKRTPTAEFRCKNTNKALSEKPPQSKTKSL